MKALADANREKEVTNFIIQTFYSIIEKIKLLLVYFITFTSIELGSGS